MIFTTLARIPYALKILQRLSRCMKVDNFDALKVDEVKVQLALSFRALFKNLPENIIER